MRIKKCIKCHKAKTIAKFSNHPGFKDGIESRCKKCLIEYRRKYRAENREKLLEGQRKWRYAHVERSREMSKNSQARCRKRVIEYYGGNPPKCACCGEGGYEFLTIDHINNDGNEHRKSIIKKITSIHRWIIKNNYPRNMFQVLCYNCNCAKAHYGGTCPHKQKEV